MEWSGKTWVARMLANVTPSVDGVKGGSPRVSRYDEPYVISRMSKKYPHIDGGEYRVASMSPGAASLQLGLSAAFSAVAAALVLGNSAKASNALSKRVYLDYIRLVVGTVPTSATALWGATFLDDANRTPTTLQNNETVAAATQAAFPAVVSDPNMDNDQAAIVGRPYFPNSIAAGAPILVPAAGANARRIVGNIPLRAQIPVAGDEYYIDFGSQDVGGGSLLTAAPAGASKVVIAHPGVIIGAAQWFLLHLWGPGNITAGLAFSGIDVGFMES